ncbi:MAG: GTPase domain-containing protein [Promethearchaeota archaeon]
MAKKLLFIGPPAAGKSTLRKIFFEGESSIKLLENPLAPTIGSEINIYQLKEEIGVFDLSGQELERWLVHEPEILKDTDLVLIVVDISNPIKENLNLINKILNGIKENYNLVKTYILFHKIDLISKRRLGHIKFKVKKHLRFPNVRFYFTSIKDDYFIDTMEIFIKIMKKIQHTIKYDYNVVSREKESEEEVNLKNNPLINIFSILENERVIDLNELAKKTNMALSELEMKLKNFFLEGIISKKNINGVKFVYLTKKGENFYNSLRTLFIISQEQKSDSKTNTYNQEDLKINSINVSDFTEELNEKIRENIFNGKINSDLVNEDISEEGSIVKEFNNIILNKYFGNNHKEFKNFLESIKNEENLLNCELKNKMIKISSELLFGIMISDYSGRTLLIHEIEPNILREKLKNEKNPNFDIELVPMFINALQQFSKEINIKDFSGFKVSGSNLKILSVAKNNITITAFTSFFLDENLVYGHLKEFLGYFLDNYAEKMEQFNITGNIGVFNDFKDFLNEQIIRKISKLIVQWYNTLKQEINEMKIANPEDEKLKRSLMKLINEEILLKTNVPQIELMKLRKRVMNALLADKPEDLIKILDEIDQITRKVDYIV